jgi:hypothetical protein
MAQPPCDDAAITEREEVRSDEIVAAEATGRSRHETDEVQSGPADDHRLQTEASTGKVPIEGGEHLARSHGYQYNRYQPDLLSECLGYSEEGIPQLPQVTPGPPARDRSLDLALDRVHFRFLARRQEWVFSAAF